MHLLQEEQEEIKLVPIEEEYQIKEEEEIEYLNHQLEIEDKISQNYKKKKLIKILN